MGRSNPRLGSMVPRSHSAGKDAGGTASSPKRNPPPGGLEKLRIAEEAPLGEQLLLATLKVRIPNDRPWPGPFSRAHSGLTLEILNRSEVSETVSVSDVWIRGRPAGVWAREIAAFPDVSKVDSLAEVGEGCIYRVTYENPPVIYLYRKLGLPIHFPLTVQAGFLRWELVARRSESEPVLNYVRSVDPEFQVVSIRRRPLRSHLPELTDAQQTLLSRAMEAGYFAVPRGITLTELARQLDRSKSAVSEALAIIERKLLESAVRPSGVYA